ncbi:hypothetical protein ACSBR1_019066 [Camellia fascicularis]
MERVFHHGISSSIPNSLPSLVRVELLGNQSGLPEPALSLGRPKIEFQGTPNFHPHSLPEYQDGLINGAPCNSAGMATNISASPSERIENRQFCKVSSNGHPLELNDAVFGSSRNGSCSPGRHYIWSNSNNPPQPQGMIWPNGVCTTQPPPQLHAFPRAPSHMMNTLLPMNNHHVGLAPSADNKKQFELDIDRIMRREDNRTTLMIKNIPNKQESNISGGTRPPTISALLRCTYGVIGKQIRM